MDKILESFIEEPEKEFFVREIARKLNKSPATISKYLKNYEKQGILISKEKFNHLLFKANTESIKFKQLKLSYNLNKIYESGLIDFLIKEFNHPNAIILFGSFAKAENIKTSDIDIFIVSSRKKELNLEKYEKKLGYNVQLFVEKDIKKLKEKNKELLNNIINGITLYGFFEVFQ
jgi:predicted nucleotidyltransferase